MRGDLRIDGEALAVCDVAGGPGERHVDVKAALINDRVESKLRLFRRRQRRQCAANQALHRDVALTVFLESLAGLWTVMPTDQARRIAFTPRQRPRHLPHKEVTLAVLL